MNPKLVIFDVDGTLVRPKSGAEFRKTADDWELLPGRVEKLAALAGSGTAIALATNQGGVAYGFHTLLDATHELVRLAREVGAVSYYLCPYHPQGKLKQYRLDHEDRKPRPGMLLRILKDTNTPAASALMVGDRPEDQQAAEAAGVPFQWAEAFFAQG